MSLFTDKEVKALDELFHEVGVYLNFFDDRLHSLQHDNLGVILEAYFSLYPEKKNAEKVYCFFDEIQVVPGWEPFVDRLMRMEKCEVYITGSSAQMLSREIATQMRGRALATFMEGLSDADDEADDQDADDEEEIDTPRVGRRAAMARYMGVSRSYARARAQGKQVSKTSSTGRIVEWLGDRIIAEDVAKEIGKSLIIQSALRRFVNPVRGYIDKIPARYRRFRRTKQAEGRWYRAEGFAPTDVHPLEVDLILLAILRNTDSLIAGIRSPDEEAKKTLDRLQNLYYTQVLVDEATDFSPIQLACMAAMSRPRIRSFFACGDFNQRFTSCGVRSIDQVKWAIPKIAEERISIAYRHSNQLHRLAQAIIGLSGDGAADVHISEEYADNEGFAPVLTLNADKKDVLAAWLAARIKEIEKSVHKLPSIAVLVNDEEAVRSVAEALKRAVEDQNIQVIPCPDGQVRGRDSAVRVFNVQHIKGLEFEAVFFVSIDKLAESQPDLFEKYLYVGATRAATYFGMTCEKDFPAKLGSIQELFQDAWTY